METVTEKWEKEFQAVANSINKNVKLLKEEKVAKNLYSKLATFAHCPSIFHLFLVYPQTIQPARIIYTEDRIVNFLYVGFVNNTLLTSHFFKYTLNVYYEKH